MYVISIVRNNNSTLFLSETNLLNLKVVYTHDSIDSIINQLSYLLKVNLSQVDIIKNNILSNGYDTIASTECFYIIIDMNNTLSDTDTRGFFSDKYISYIQDKCKSIIRNNSIDSIIKKENQNDSLFKNK